MNRRGLLALLGFAPIAGAAMALPRAADPVKLANGGMARETKAVVGERGPEAVIPLMSIHRVWVDGQLIDIGTLPLVSNFTVTDRK